MTKKLSITNNDQPANRQLVIFNHQKMICKQLLWYLPFRGSRKPSRKVLSKLECGPVPNAMAVLPNIGGAVCSMPESLANAHYYKCLAVTLPRRETSWNLQGCPKLPNRSKPLVGRSSPYCEDMRRRYRCLTTFFPIVDKCLSCEDTARQICAIVPKWQFLRPAFSASLVQHISDMHSKFALRPHHVWKYGRHPISDRWD